MRGSQEELIAATRELCEELNMHSPPSETPHQMADMLETLLQQHTQQRMMSSPNTTRTTMKMMVGVLGGHCVTVSMSDRRGFSPGVTDTVTEGVPVTLLVTEGVEEKDSEEVGDAPIVCDAE